MLNSDFRDMLSAFCEEKVEFMLVGAYAVAAHGLPRATGYIDLWIRSSDDNVARVWRALNRFGAPLSSLSKKDLTKPGNVIQIGVAPRRIDILTEITGVSFDEAKAEQILISLEGLTIPVIGWSHLIRNKKAVGRPQDQADVARLEAIHK
ncbi:MAG: hypothetical protein AABM67_09480 [Acidobacteriota bacterium]